MLKQIMIEDVTTVEKANSYLATVPAGKFLRDLKKLRATNKNYQEQVAENIKKK